MITVVHMRQRPMSTTNWLCEEDFRYWNDRRAVLKQRGILISEMFSTTATMRIRSEVWASLADFEQFRDDICARVIDSVVRHEESLYGVVHKTFIGTEES